MTLESNNESPLERAIKLLGGQSAIATKLEVTPGAVSQWLRGERPLPPLRAALIHRLTDGQVKAHELLPDFPWPASSVAA